MNNFSDAPSHTSPSSEELGQLLSRVESASGPDRTIDRALWAEFQGGDYPGVLSWDGQGVAPFTASIDAAMALRDRAFPSWSLFVGDLDPSDPRAVATLAQGYPDQPSYRGFAPCQKYALAVCAALLRALLGNDSTGNRNDGSSPHSSNPTPNMDGNNDRG